jgi:hypothetical protein
MVFEFLVSCQSKRQCSGSAEKRHASGFYNLKKNLGSCQSKRQCYAEMEYMPSFLRLVDISSCSTIHFAEALLGRDEIQNSVEWIDGTESWFRAKI